MNIKLDLVNKLEEVKKNEPASTPVADGKYKALISVAEYKEGINPQDLYVNVGFTIISPETFKNRVVYRKYYQTFSDPTNACINIGVKGIAELSQAALGKYVDYPNELLYKTVEIDIKNSTKDGKEWCNVTKVSKLQKLTYDNKPEAQDNSDLDDKIPF